MCYSNSNWVDYGYGDFVKNSKKINQNVVDYKTINDITWVSSVSSYNYKTISIEDITIHININEVSFKEVRFEKIFTWVNLSHLLLFLIVNSVKTLGDKNIGITVSPISYSFNNKMYRINKVDNKTINELIKCLCSNTDVSKIIFNFKNFDDLKKSTWFIPATDQMLKNMDSFLEQLEFNSFV